MAKQIVYLGNKLSRHGKNPTGVDTLAPQLEKLGYKVIAVSSFSNKFLRLASMLCTILRRSTTTDLVLMDTYSTRNFWYAYLGGKFSRLLNLPYYCILHGGGLPRRLETKPKPCRELFGKAAVNIAPSKFLLQAFDKAGYDNLLHIPNTIPIGDYPFLERHNFKPKLLWLRGFSSIYNPLLALKVLKGIGEAYPGAKMLMAGPVNDEELFFSCQEFAKKHRLDVKFPGKLAKNDWIGRSTDYDIFINTTNFDNTPVSVIEAMALGLLVFSTNVGGLPQLIDNKVDGFLLPPHDECIFVKKIKDYLGNNDRSMVITAKARNKAEKFDWNVVKMSWKRLLG